MCVKSNTKEGFGEHRNHVQVNAFVGAVAHFPSRIRVKFADSADLVLLTQPFLCPGRKPDGGGALDPAEARRLEAQSGVLSFGKTPHELRRLVAELPDDLTVVQVRSDASRDVRAACVQMSTCPTRCVSHVVSRDTGTTCTLGTSRVESRGVSRHSVRHVMRLCYVALLGHRVRSLVRTRALWMHSALRHCSDSFLFYVSAWWKFGCDAAPSKTLLFSCDHTRLYSSFRVFSSLLA